MQIVTEENDTLQFNLELKLTDDENNKLVIKRELDKNKRKVWPLVVVKVIIEMLVNGTRPSAVVKNLECAFRHACPHATIVELPNVDFVRKTRGVIRILTETLAACQLAKDKDWKQIWWDGTSRRTVALTTFAAGIKSSNSIKSMLLSCSHVTIGESLRTLCRPLWRL